MSPQVRSLVSKEWAERRSTLFLALALALIFCGYCLAYEIEYRPRALVSSVYTSCMMLGWLGALLLSMSTASGEHSTRTLLFTTALPVSLRQTAWVRLIGAWICLAIPLVTCAFVITLVLVSGLVEQAGLRGETSERLYERPDMSRLSAVAFLWTTTAIALFSTIQLVTLLSFLGTRTRTEARIGFFGAVIILLWAMIMPIRSNISHQFLSDWIGALVPHTMAIPWGYRELDGSSYSDLELAPGIWGPLLVNLFLTGLLGYWFSCRYGIQHGGESSAPGQQRPWRFHLPTIPTVRLPGEIGSLIWLDLRQSIPLCMSGLMLALLIAAINLLDVRGGFSLSRLAGELPACTWFVGMLWSAIVGVGIFSGELQPGLQHFWRTRPIAPTRWFWTKFLAGLCAVVLFLDLIPVAVGWKAPNQFGINQTGFAYLACMPLIHSQIYAMAVGAICWVRRPAVAAAGAILVRFALESVITSIPGPGEWGTIEIYNKLAAAERLKGSFSLMSENYPFVYGFILVVALAAVVIAQQGALKSRAAIDA